MSSAAVADKEDIASIFASPERYNNIILEESVVVSLLDELNGHLFDVHGMARLFARQMHQKFRELHSDRIDWVVASCSDGVGPWVSQSFMAKYGSLVSKVFKDGKRSCWSSSEVMIDEDEIILQAEDVVTHHSIQARSLIEQAHLFNLPRFLPVIVCIINTLPETNVEGIEIISLVHANGT